MNKSIKSFKRNSEESTRNKGFTMVELIVVIVIILVLAAVLVPQLMKYVEKSKEASCKSNRATLLTVLNTEQAASLVSDQELTEAQLQEQIDNSNAECPSGGDYTVQLTPDAYGYNTISVSCSVHGDGKENGGGSGTNTVSHGFLDTFTKYVGNITGGKNNDKIREAFFKENGNKWPSLNVGDKSYSIQPFYNQSSGETWLYATDSYSDATNGKWNVQMVYNPTDKKWYQATTYQGQAGGASSINFKDLEDLNNVIHNATHNNGKNKWVEVEDYTESK